MKIRSQLTTPAVAVDRNLDNTVIEGVMNINNNFDNLLALTDPTMLGYIATVADRDFSEIFAAASRIENLSVTSIALPTGSQATVTLVGNELQFGVPAGSNGINGLSPVIESAYNSSTGMLTFEITKYIDMSGVILPVVEEI